MVNFTNIVNNFGKITDCVPIISSFTNATILLYQLVHKVDKTANPFKETSWKDDIKIYMLAKHHWITCISIIPIFGNLTCFAYYLAKCITHMRNPKTRSEPPQNDYLRKAISQGSWGLEKHGVEVGVLALARHPVRTDEELEEALRLATSLDEKEIFNLILGSKKTPWPPESIEKALCFAKSGEIATSLLETATLTDEQAGSVVLYLSGNFRKNNTWLIQLILTYYPTIERDALGKSLAKAATKKSNESTILLLLNHSSKIEEKYVIEALKNASDVGSKNTLELIFQQFPHLIPTQIEYLLTNASKRGDTTILKWLLTTYEQCITTAHIGQAIAAATQSSYFGEEDKYGQIIQGLIDQYPSLTGEDLEPLLLQAATSNLGLFEFYLKIFPQLEPKHLQTLLNNAVFVYGKEDESYPITHKRGEEKWQKVARLIQKQFPSMVAIPPVSYLLNTQLSIAVQ